MTTKQTYEYTDNTCQIVKNEQVQQLTENKGTHTTVLMEIQDNMEFERRQ